MAQLYRTLTGQSQKSHLSDHSTQPQSMLSRTTTTDPLTGTLHHLSEQQVQKLDQFKVKLQKEGWWSPTAVNGKPTHDDGTLLRYLRARKFDLNGAYGQFTDTEKWLKEQRVEELYEHFDVERYEQARLLYPQWTGRRDRRGIPLYVFEIKGLDSKNVSKYQKASQAYKEKLPNHKNLSTPAKHLPLFALYHNLLNFILPMVSTLERPNPEIPVTTSTNIVDISGVGLTQFWNLKAHMQDASVLATAHYPETLDRIYIIGAPSFFPTVWGWIKRWFDPVTVSKIFILGKHEAKATLTRFIDPKNFPKKYGGEMDWEWGMVPHLDHETTVALERDGNKGWVKGPCLWLDNQRIVVGSENGKLRRSDKEIAEKKPVVYAADYTENPVHADRKASGAPGAKINAPNGDVSSPSSPTKADSQPAKAAVGAGLATSAATAAAAAATTSKAETSPLSPANENKSAPPPPYLPKESLRTSPVDKDTLVHVPKNQPAFPSTTAEYVTEKTAASHQNQSTAAQSTAAQSTAAQSTAAQSTAAQSTAAQSTAAQSAAAVSSPSAPDPSPTEVKSAPPVAIPQPGPAPDHTTAMNKVIIDKLAPESVSSIPSSVNGTVPHPELITASDMSKGLAIDANRVGLDQSGLAEKTDQLAVSVQRPGIDRFVTAAEF